jgi:hypothetical protein
MSPRAVFAAPVESGARLLPDQKLASGRGESAKENFQVIDKKGNTVLKVL